MRPSRDAPLTQRQPCICAACGYLQSIPPLPPRAVARCVQCQQTIRRIRREPLTRPLACALAGLALYAVVIALQFMAIEVFGRGNAASLVSFPVQLTASGFWELAVLFLLFIIILPPVKLLLLVLVLLGLRLPQPPRALRILFRWYSAVGPWAMVEVFLVGFFVAYSRLVGLATVDLGAAVWALGGLMLTTVAADATLDAEAVWQAVDGRCPRRRPLPRQPVRQPVGCPSCGLVCETDPAAAATPHIHHCPRCGARLWPRKPDSLRRTWALLIAASICAIGAYVYPIMTVTRLGQGQPSTIIGGLIELAAIGWWPIAIIVFIASITIPLFKLLALACMLISVHRGSSRRLRSRTGLYYFVEAIGRWSMIDIFMVSILTTLVQLGFLGTVRPNGGAIAFAAVVILTMLAAYSFDPRLMWDAAARQTRTTASAPRQTKAAAVATSRPESSGA